MSITSDPKKPKKSRKGEKLGGYKGARPTEEVVLAELEKLELKKPTATSKSVTVIDHTLESLERREALVLKTEWALFNKSMAPHTWLVEHKKIHEARAHTIVGMTGGASAWYTEKDKLKDQVTETLVKRHVDMVAEIQETHIAGSKITLARAMEFLTKLTVEAQPMLNPDGSPKLDADGNPRMTKTMRSIDIVNAANAIEKAQMIYRRALGLNESEGGLAQILEAIQRTGATHNHLHLHGGAEAAKELDLDPEEQKKRDALQKMSYDDIAAIVEFKREQKKLAEEEKKKKK